MPRQQMSVLVDPLRKLLRRGATGNTANMLRKLHAADVARLVNFLSDEQQDTVFTLMLREAPERAADLICELDVPMAVGFLTDLPDAEVASIIAELDPDDAAEIIPAMPEEQAERVLDLMKDSASKPVEGLLSYEEETAGRIMSPEVFALEEHVPVADAIAALRTSSEELEMVFYLYVVDDRRQRYKLADQFVVNANDDIARLKLSVRWRPRNDLVHREHSRLIRIGSAK